MGAHMPGICDLGSRVSSMGSLDADEGRLTTYKSAWVGVSGNQTTEFHNVGSTHMEIKCGILGDTSIARTILCWCARGRQDEYGAPARGLLFLIYSRLSPEQPIEISLTSAAHRPPRSGGEAHMTHDNVGGRVLSGDCLKSQVYWDVGKAKMRHRLSASQPGLSWTKTAFVGEKDYNMRRVVSGASILH